MTNKMTKKDYFNELATLVASAEISAENKEALQSFINHEIELLSRKSNNTSDSKKVKEQEGVMGEILEALATVTEPVTISELQKAVPRMAEYSNQKLSAMLRKLAEMQKVNKTIEKKKSYFSLA
jgi:HSP90 family molecular chaperone